MPGHSPSWRPVPSAKWCRPWGRRRRSPASPASRSGCAGRLSRCCPWRTGQRPAGSDRRSSGGGGCPRCAAACTGCTAARGSAARHCPCCPSGRCPPALRRGLQMPPPLSGVPCRSRWQTGFRLPRGSPSAAAGRRSASAPASPSGRFWCIRPDAGTFSCRPACPAGSGSSRPSPFQISLRSRCLPSSAPRGQLSWPCRPLLLPSQGSGSCFPSG